MKIGLLGWDYSGIDPDGFSLVEHGRERGHEMSFATLDEVEYQPGPDGPEVLLKGERAASFDAFINRSRVFGPDGQERMERMRMLSGIPGVQVFSPADAWQTASSKFLTAQRLSQAGLPTPPVRSVSSLPEVEAACAEWGTVIIKPSHGFGGADVERIADFAAEKAVAEDLLSRTPRLLCQPYYPTSGGEYRITVAGDATPINILKLPRPGAWRCKTLEGATFEWLDAPAELVDLAVRATRAIGLTLAGLDILPHAGGYLILEVNEVPGFLSILGRDQHRQVLDGVFDWVEEKTEAARAG
ncbi:ATP-grasp domain-containing protein [Streptomyces armeniacus]|uniref:ATP-grasp domain-containing protein n=1 Tax=Streptomyces armeniacus TaxID=83291 RepID=A0A345XJU9_9ACTN|nr:ATP-grasp domain-containing protein [Streptomyces armeniacus]AXK31915.1 ATP-grasp domain-containing protein [Streptomyces armeniacus]